MDPLTVLTEPRRRTILELLRDGERSAGDLAEQFDVTFGAVSQHLAVLRDAGFVTVRQDGRRRIYALDHEGLAPYRTMLEAMWSSKLDQLAAAVAEDQRTKDTDP